MHFFGGWFNFSTFAAVGTIEKPMDFRAPDFETPNKHLTC